MQQNAASSISAYAEKPQLGLEVDFGSDPASGASFFQSDGRKHDDLKQMLDSNKDGLKLEAMKRIIGMIARGRDASDLFPAVVKNVVSKNIEVKKLVYVYLVRYAEEQQDLALLSISTFQRALKDPNQLIRASALRVLSSIRVNMIVPIVMLAIRDSASDLSPYVRKTAAHAIPKLYSLDQEQKDELVIVIEKLLSDRTTLVVGSAVMAFDEVCPERVDLIHKNYRKLCNLLVDVDEWGQVIIINMLTRYARTQFKDPNANEDIVDNASDSVTCINENFYGEKLSISESETSNKKIKNNNKSHSSVNTSKKKRSSTPTNTYIIDFDHRLLLRQTKPLLQSRNASVVMAVAQLYHHVAPRSEVQLIAKALIRLLRSHKEVQSIALTCIASISTKRKGIFEPHIKSFFVHTSDPTHIKLLKLDILTNLASATIICLILREFQTYVSSSDHLFVAATIQAIGRCASSIAEVTESCLSGLVHLLSSHDEHVVAESVVVIKKLLQTKAAEHFEIIIQMAKLIDFIMVPAARASIIWLIGEYNEKVSKVAPDVLRKMAKTFVDEEDVVKLQILNLGVKLYLTNPQQTSLLCQYVFTLARYDTNYDVRDRARLLRQFIFPTNATNTILLQNARKVFLAKKSAPAPESKYLDVNTFQLGSLSHYLNMRATGYKNLPPFPKVAPDSSVRNIEGYMHKSRQSSATTIALAANKEQAMKEKDFVSQSDGISSSYTESSSSLSNSNGTLSESESEQPTEISTTKKLIAAKMQNSISMATNLKVANSNNKENFVASGTSDSETSSTYSNDDASDTETDNNSTLDYTLNITSINDKQHRQTKGTKEAIAVTDTAIKQLEKKSNLDLLSFDDIPSISPVLTPSLFGFLTPGSPIQSTQPHALQSQYIVNRIELVGPSYVEFAHKELLNKVTGHGLQLNYRFTRAPHLYSSTMVSIELQFINLTNNEITNVRIGQKALPAGISLNGFAPIQQLQGQQTLTKILGVDFNDSTHAINFEITSSAGNAKITLKPPIGELVRAVKITLSYFKEERTKLRGMNEHQSRLPLTDLIDLNMLKQKLFECINVAYIPSQLTDEDVHYFAGQTLTSKSLVLITLSWITGEASVVSVTVNCEKMIIGSMILNELRNILQTHFKP